MTSWMKRVRGAVTMGLVWAVTWATIAVLVGLAVDPDGSMDEMWPAIGAYPGFLGGVAFATVLGVLGRRRRIDELSLSRTALWGGGAGLVVGSIPFLIGDSASEVPLWLLALAVVGGISVLAAASAAGSLALARRAQRRELGAGGDVPTAIGERRAADRAPANRQPTTR